MVTKRGPGRPPKKRGRGRPKGSRNKPSPLTIKDYAEKIMKPTIVAMRDQNQWKVKEIEYVKDNYPKTASFRSRLEAATIKFEQAINETIEQLKGKM